MECHNCKTEVEESDKYCSECGTKQKIAYRPFGLWKVTTEGDIEGKSIRDLGIHEGYLADIAFALAGQSCYTLQFAPMNPDRNSASKKCKKQSVSVSMNIDSNTWNMAPTERVKWFRQNVVNDPNVVIEPGSYHASVVLRRKD